MTTSTTIRCLRAAILAFSLILGIPDAHAQFATPTIDGTIGGGEYGTHINGQNQETNGSQVWYMTWDNTNLYVAISSATVSEAAVLYLDKDPIAPINGGSNSNGTLAGFNYDGTNFAALQFRADLVVYFKDSYREYRTADGSGGWSSATSGFGSLSTGAGDVREVAIPWSAIGGRPSSFLWSGYVTSGGGFVYGEMPVENNSGFIGTSAREERYYTVSSTADASSTKPFSRNSFVFNSTTDESGFGAISVYDFTMNSTGRTITRAAGGGGGWTIGGSLHVGAGTIDFGSSTTSADVTGIVVVSSGAILTVSSAVGGDLSLSASGVNSGTISGSGSGTVRTVGTSTLQQDGTFSAPLVINSGTTTVTTTGLSTTLGGNVTVNLSATLHVPGLTVAIDGDFTVQTFGQVTGMAGSSYLRLNGATITNYGTIAPYFVGLSRTGAQSIDGSGAWNANIFRVDNGSTTSLALPFSIAPGVIEVSGATLNTNGNSLVYTVATGGIVVSPTGTITGTGPVVVSGTVTLQQDGTFSAPLIMGAGTTTITTTASSTILTGYVAVTTGATMLAGSPGNSVYIDGDLSVQSGGIIDGIPGSFLYLRGTSVVNDGSNTHPFTGMYRAGSQSLGGAGTWTGNTLRFDNGSLTTLTSNVTIGTGILEIENATLDPGGNIFSTTSGGINIGLSGTVSGAGTFRTQATTTISHTGTFSAALQVNSGTTTFGTFLAGPLGEVTVNSGATLRVGSMAQLHIGGNTTVDGGGTIDGADASSILYLYGSTITNNGSISVQDAIFFGTTQSLSGTGTWTGYTVQIEATSTTSLIGGSAVIDAFNLYVTGVLDLGVHALTFTGTQFTIHLGGSLAGTGSFVFYGTGVQYLHGIPSTPPFTFYNLAVNNPAGVDMATYTSADALVANTLTLIDGNITTGTHKVTIGPAGFVARVSGHIVGNLEKNVATGPTNSTFEIGDASNYTPADIAFNNVTTAGYLTASTAAGDHPDIATSGLDPAKGVNRYWTLTPDGSLAFTTYDATLNFAAGDVDGPANTANFNIEKYNGSWATTTTGTQTAASTQATGLASFSDFAIAEPAVGPLDHFLVEAVGGGAIGTQTAGTPFSIQITAQDASNNTVTAFASTVDITSTGTLSSGSGTTLSFTAGVLASHSVTISNTGSFTITATATGGPEFGTSNAFTVDPGPLANFLVEAAGGGNILTQNAGTPFSIKVTARDALNNTVTGFVSTVDVSSTGTLSGGSGTTVAFTAGILASHNVTISNVGSFSITATRTGGSEFGTSNLFTVNPGSLDHYLVEAAGGGSIPTQTAGVLFNVQVTARDIFNNTVTGFVSTVDISSTGTLSSGGGTTAPFTAGILATHGVTITNTGSFTIDAITTAGSETGTSNAFTVDPAPLDHYLVEAAGGGNILTQNGGVPFNIMVTAQDVFNNIQTAFTGTVEITSTGTLSSGSGTTVALTAGVLATHGVTITNPGNFTITATNSGGPEFGTSNLFTVLVPVFSVNPDSLDFGKVLIGTTEYDSVYVTNTGNIVLNISGTISDNTTDFDVTPAGLVSINPTETAAYAIAFHPPTTGVKQANIVFSHNGLTTPDTVYVAGLGAKLFLTVTPDSIAKKKTTGSALIRSIKRGKGYPNWANLVEETVVQGGFQPGSTESDGAGGMRVGISHMAEISPNVWKPVAALADLYGWVRLSKWNFGSNKGQQHRFLQTTLRDYKATHTGAARGLDTFYLFGGTPRPLTQQRKYLRPSHYSNKLYAEVVAAKFNIAISQMGKTPVGFGELIHDLDGTPYDEMIVRDIVAEADTALTYWVGRPLAEFDSLYSALYRLNRAFIGELDTVTFVAGNKLLLRGKVDILDVPYVREGPVPPIVLTPTTDETEDDDPFEDDEFESTTPVTAKLYQNYPNPFNPSTTIAFRLKELSRVTVKVFDLLGRELGTLLHDEELDEGYQTLQFSAGDLATGVYFYQIDVRNLEDENLRTLETRKMLLLK